MSAKKRVLLVDDESSVRTSLKMILEPTYELLCAAEGEEGLSLYKREAPDLVLLDVMLPGEDGLSVLHTMRTEDPRIPIIMLTGTRMVKTVVDAMKIGAADYVTKPFEIEELRLTMEKTLEKQALEREVHYLRAQVANKSPINMVSTIWSGRAKPCATFTPKSCRWPTPELPC